MARYNRGDINNTVSVAFENAKKNDKPVYIIAVYGGYRIVHGKPPGSQSFYIVNQNGRIDLDDYDCVTGKREVKQVNQIKQEVE